MTMEQCIAEIDREWLKMRLSFVPFDRYVSYGLNVHGRCLNDILEALVLHDELEEEED